MSKVEGSKKSGGRTKGTPNKKSLCLIQSLEENQINIVSELSKLLPMLGPDKKADVLMQLMSFVYPKRKAVELVLQDEQQRSPQIILSMPSNGREAVGN